MRAILTGAIAAIEAVAVALATLLIVGAIAFLVWWLSFDLAAEPRDVLAAIGGGWLLAHFVPLSVSFSAETMQLLGFSPQALSFTLSLAPLGITLVTVAFAARSGWRFGNRGGSGVAGVIGGALGFGASAGAIDVFSRASALPLPLTALIGAALYGLVSLVAFGVRAAHDGHGWWEAMLEGIEAALAKAHTPKAGAFSARTGEALRLAGMLLAAYVGIAAFGLGLALVLGYADVIASSQSLQLSFWGATMMFVLQLAMLPLFIVWSGAWITGAGFSIGLGSSASPFGALLGPLPGIPLLAAIPDGWGPAAVLAPVALALVGVGIGVALGKTARRRSVPGLLGLVGAASILVGLGVALLGWAASGSLGPGRLAVVGPEVWISAALAAVELGTGCLLGALAARADLARRAAAAIPIRRDEIDLAAELPGRRAGAFAEGGFSEERGEADPDEQLTEPIEPLAPVVHLRPLDEFARPAPEPVPEPEMDPDAESGSAPLPGRPQREPVLFDQHDEQETTEIEPLPASAQARGAAGLAAPDPANPDADALVEAYSWDRAYGLQPVEWRPQDAEAQDAGAGETGEKPRGGRSGWRRPGRKS